MSEDQVRRPTLSMNRKPVQPQVQAKPKKEKVAKPVKPPKVPYALQMLGNDEYIKHCIDNNLSITVILLSGIEYSGIVISGDRYAFTLLIDGVPVTIFKHGMESYQPTIIE